MMTLTTILIVLGILTIHFFADFVMQHGSWATNKSKDFSSLFIHTSVYTFIWYIACHIWLSYFLFSDFETYFKAFKGVIWFLTCTLIFHTATDYVTSRIVKKKFERKDYGYDLPNTGAFTVIGLDQLLHYFQLLICYYLFIN